MEKSKVPRGPTAESLGNRHTRRSHLDRYLRDELMSRVRMSECRWAPGSDRGGSRALVVCVCRGRGGGRRRGCGWRAEGEGRDEARDGSRGRVRQCLSGYAKDFDFCIKNS